MRLLAIAILAVLLTSCARRHPVTLRELSGQGIEPPSGYEAYLP